MGNNIIYDKINMTISSTNSGFYNAVDYNLKNLSMYDIEKVNLKRACCIRDLNGNDGTNSNANDVYVAMPFLNDDGSVITIRVKYPTGTLNDSVCNINNTQYTALNKNTDTDSTACNSFYTNFCSKVLQDRLSQGFKGIDALYYEDNSKFNNNWFSDCSCMNSKTNQSIKTQLGLTNKDIPQLYLTDDIVCHVNNIAQPTKPYLNVSMWNDVIKGMNIAYCNAEINATDLQAKNINISDLKIIQNCSATTNTSNGISTTNNNNTTSNISTPNTTTDKTIIPIVDSNNNIKSKNDEIKKDATDKNDTNFFEKYKWFIIIGIVVIILIIVMIIVIKKYYL